MNDTVASSRGLVDDEETKGAKPSPQKTEHTAIQSDDLKAQLLHNDANSSNKYMLDGDVNIEKRN